MYALIYTPYSGCGPNDARVELYETLEQAHEDMRREVKEIVAEEGSPSHVIRYALAYIKNGDGSTSEWTIVKVR